MYFLNDTFNGRALSRHKTIRAAVKAQKMHLRRVKKTNGQNSYLTYSITSEDGQDIREEVADHY